METEQREHMDSGQEGGKIAVVILNWNGEKLLEEFMPSVIAHTPSNADIVIADNGSTDGSVDLIKKNYPNVTLLNFEKNHGFANGYNVALAKVTADYYVLLNSDVEVTQNWIAPIIELMNTDPLIAACQPKLLSHEKRTDFEYAGAAGGFIDKYGYPFCRGRIFNTIEDDHGQYNDIKEIFWASGACLFIKAKLFHEVGGFDKDFFAHMEEIDLCWRLKNQHYKILYCPDVTLYHLGGGSLPKSNPRKTYLNFRNNLTILYKNLPANRLIYVLFARFLLDGIAGIKFLLFDSFGDFLAVIRAHFSFYASIGKNHRKRRVCRANLKHQTTTGIYHGNIVIGHFLRKKKKFSDLPLN